MTGVRLGSTTVVVFDGYTRTLFDDGAEVYALHTEQPGQRETARELGYASAAAMNREHDLTHALLAYWLGLGVSPTLRDVATGRTATEIHFLEERAVLAIQAFARRMGVDLVAVARAISREP